MRTATLWVGLILAAGVAAAAEPSLPPASALDERLGAAQDLLAQRQFKEAIREFKAAERESAGECPLCQIGLAKAYNGAGAFKDAQRSAESALAQTADNGLLGVANNELGLALVSAAGAVDPDIKKLAQAEAAFLRALELTDSDLTRFNLGVVYLRSGKDEAGVAVLRAFVAKQPEAPQAQIAREWIENPLRARKRLLPDVDFVTLAGEFLTPESLAGNVTLLDFWGTWCAPCRAAVPGLRLISHRLAKDPFVLISVSSDSDEGVLKNFVAQNEMTWHQVWDKQHEVLRKFGITQYPTYLLVDEHGEIVYTATGWSEQVEREILMRVGAAVRAAKKRASAGS